VYYKLEWFLSKSFLHFLPIITEPRKHHLFPFALVISAWYGFELVL